MEHPLQLYRVGKKLSRQQLAKQLQCSTAMIGHIENGIRKVSAELAITWEKRGVPRCVSRPDLWCGYKT